MSMSNFAEANYHSGHAAKLPKQVEYDAIARITGSLKRYDNRRDDFPRLADALHKNREIWTAFATDVVNPDNQLPTALKAQIFYLSEFTNAQTRKVLAGEADCAALIDINTAIMRGLAQERVPS